MNEYNFGYNPQIGFDLWRKQQEQDAPVEVAEGGFNVGYDPMTSNVQQPFGGQPQAMEQTPTIEPQEELGFLEKLQANPNFGDALMGAGRAMVGGASRLPQSGLQRLSAGLQAFGDSMSPKTNEMEALKKQKLMAEINKLNNPTGSKNEKLINTYMKLGYPYQQAVMMVNNPDVVTDSSKKVGEEAYKAKEQAEKIRANVYATEKVIKDMKDSDFGAGAGIKLNLKKFANALGAKFDEKQLANAQYVNSTAMNFVLNLIDQTKGAISEREMDLFIKASPGLSNTKAGNLKILKLLKFASDYKKERSDLILENLSKNGGVGFYNIGNEVDKMLQEKYKTRKQEIFGDIDKYKSTQPTNKGDTGVVIPQNDIETMKKYKTNPIAIKGFAKKLNITTEELLKRIK